VDAEISNNIDADHSEPDVIRIMVADDHELVRQALINLFEKQPDFQVVAVAGNGEEAVKLAGETQPDVIVMDITMPKLSGLEATRQIKSEYPAIGILALTVHSDNEHILSIIQAGAGGYLTKTVSNTEIVQAIRALAAGDVILSRDVSKQILKYAFQYFKKPDVVIDSRSLSNREMETLRLAAKGVPNKEIAARLGISLRSTKAYMTSVFQKLNVASRTEAVALSLRVGILNITDLEE
jgi:two-component system, NarL family, response regulator LiaR